MTKRDNLKKEIYSTAAWSFYENGYRNTTLRAIGNALGISHVAVLHHYSSKGEILVEVMKNYRSIILQKALDIFNEKPELFPDKSLGVFSYHGLLIKNFAADKKMARLFYDSRSIARYSMKPTVRQNFIDLNIRFGTFSFIEDNYLSLTTNISNDLWLSIIEAVLDQTITPEEATILFFKLLIMIKPENTSFDFEMYKDFWNKYLSTYEIDPETIIKEVVDYKDVTDDLPW